MLTIRPHTDEDLPFVFNSFTLEYSAMMLAENEGRRLTASAGKETDRG